MKVQLFHALVTAVIISSCNWSTGKSCVGASPVSPRIGLGIAIDGGPLIFGRDGCLCDCNPPPNSETVPDFDESASHSQARAPCSDSDPGIGNGE